MKEDGETDDDGPTKQRLKHAGKFQTLAGGRAKSSQRYTMLDDALGRALMRSFVSPQEYSALRRYELHWLAGGLCSSLQSVDLDRIFAVDFASMSGLAKSERQQYHRELYYGCRQAIGFRPSFVADRVACQGCSLTDVGLMLGYLSPHRGRRKAIELLSDAGYRLGRHFEELARAAR